MIDPSLVPAVAAFVVGFPILLLVVFLIVAFRYRRPGLALVVVGAVFAAWLGTMQSGVQLLHYLSSEADRD